MGQAETALDEDLENVRIHEDEEVLEDAADIEEDIEDDV